VSVAGCSRSGLKPTPLARYSDLKNALEHGALA
jgi:hypothetical protein